MTLTIRITVLILLCSFHEVVAQTKDWMRNDTRSIKFPSSQYFSGFMSEYISRDEDMNVVKERLLEEAKVQLSENIRISIESRVVNKMSNINSVSVEDFEKVNSSFTSVEISGLNVDFFMDVRKKEAFAFAWIEKAKVLDHYAAQILHTYDQIEYIKKLAFVVMENDKIDALKKLYSTNVLFRNAKETQAIMVLCGNDDPGLLMKDDFLRLQSEISIKTAEIENNRNLSLPQLAALLATSLKIQSTGGDETIRVNHFTYRDSKMVSEFSNRFTSLFTNELSKEGFQIRQDSAVVNKIGSEFFVDGTIWEDEQNSVQVVLSLYQIHANGNKNLLAGAEGWTTKEIISTSKLELKPKNYFQVIERQQLFSNKSESGGVKLELWTSKGDDGTVFREGEKIRISVRMNRPGYIRLISFWADGTQTLLINNYFVDFKKVNRILQFPLELEIACPCGVEFIQASAQTVEFVPVATKKVNGFNIITDQISNIISTNTAEGNESLSAEGFAISKKLVFTTFE